MKKEAYHFIGMGGIGMSGLAHLLACDQFQVSGSDVKKNAQIERLIKQGVHFQLGHLEKTIRKEMTVVYSTSIQENNPEFLAAKKLGCPLWHRSILLKKLMENKKALLVTGTHGKTTISALLSHVLIKASLDPSLAIGGILKGLESNARAGLGEYFIAEADESDGSFLNYSFFGAIVTNIDFDHLDYFKTKEAQVQAFLDFIEKGALAKKGPLFLCADDPILGALKGDHFSYGFSLGASYRAVSFRQEGWKVFFDLEAQGRQIQGIELALIGKHNVQNALAVFGLCEQLGISQEAILEGFKTFPGIERRMDIKGKTPSLLLIDDYAHHPKEIEATLKGLKEQMYPRRLVVVFQPHRYTRTKECLGTFKKAFQDADQVILTEIYEASEAPIAGISSETIQKEVLGSVVVQKKDLCSYLGANLRPFDVLITLGAGDITYFCDHFLAFLKENPLPKLKIGLIQGGRSKEHAISLQSADFVKQCFSKEMYDLTVFSIQKEGNWVVEGTKPERNQTPFSSTLLKEMLSCDVFFPVLHGPFGEDGTVQGFFEILGKPYVGCDFRSAAVCMDKSLTKHLVQAAHIPTLPWFTINGSVWKTDADSCLEEIEKQFNYPLFVKPLHLGSSIGVKKVETRKALFLAIEEALSFDTALLVEPAIVCRELEFAVIGNDYPVTFPPGEILGLEKFSYYDYEAKYGSAAVKATPVAELSKECREKGMELALRVYRALGCRGYARVDFFLDQEENFWLNEVNPIPGFTEISLFPKICEAHGLSSEKLIDRLVQLARVST